MTNKILIVGCNPSFKNTNPDVPFQGTRSGKILSTWIDIMGIIEYDIVNAIEQVDSDSSKIKKVYKTINWSNYRKIIALGDIAAKGLMKSGCQNFYKLPHPSPRNRILNDKYRVLLELDRCIDYLEER